MLEKGDSGDTALRSYLASRFVEILKGEGVNPSSALIIASEIASVVQSEPDTNVTDVLSEALVAIYSTELGFLKPGQVAEALSDPSQRASVLSALPEAVTKPADQVDATRSVTEQTDGESVLSGSEQVVLASPTPSPVPSPVPSPSPVGTPEPGPARGLMVDSGANRQVAEGDFVELQAVVQGGLGAQAFAFTWSQVGGSPQVTLVGLKSAERPP